MSDLSEFDVESVWISGSTWRGQQIVAHLSDSCYHLNADAREIGVEKLHTDTRVCKRCDPSIENSFGGGGGVSIAQKLRYGNPDTDTELGGAD
jgi:hypothetical protein